MIEDIELRLVNLSLVDPLFDLVDESRAHLRQWLPWVDDTQTTDDSRKFLDIAMAQHAQKKGAHYGVYVDKKLCGLCGFNKIVESSRLGEIGYWLAHEYTGKGIMTQAVRMLIDIGFEQYDLNKIEVHCATSNEKSRAVPERLGLQYEATLRQRECNNGEYFDIAVYSVLRTEIGNIGTSVFRNKTTVTLLASYDYESCVQKIRQEMLPYYQQYQLEWNEESKLQRYKECSLWSVFQDEQVGFILFYEKDDLFYIAELYIEPKFRKKGFGAAAITQARSIAAERGFNEIRIGVFKNSPAFELYKRLDFELEEEGPYTYQLLMQC